MTGTETPGRRRNAEQTREDVLVAAVAEFTAHGYATAGVRQIAERAGVTAMMINRYFGSKEGLFEAAVERSFAPPTVVGQDEADLAGSIASRLAARTAAGSEVLDPFLLMLRSASDPVAGPIVRRGIEEHVGARLTDQLQGPDPDARAELVLAMLAGTWLMRTVLGTDGLRDVSEEHLVALLRPTLAALVEDGPAGGS
ncbi:TetR/AcrR family transcriptional regulator [Promicromonospora sukumoe]|uniref:TetR/AcrR family transcriptional regulator n=1 Tax=Promicromonospora sukumoe TaxID=88382 RepID=UPI0037C8B572